MQGPRVASKRGRQHARQRAPNAEEAWEMQRAVLYARLLSLVPCSLSAQHRCHLSCLVLHSHPWPPPPPPPPSMQTRPSSGTSTASLRPRHQHQHQQQINHRRRSRSSSNNPHPTNPGSGWTLVSLFFRLLDLLCADQGGPARCLHPRLGKCRSSSSWRRRRRAMDD